VNTRLKIRSRRRLSSGLHSGLRVNFARASHSLCASSLGPSIRARSVSFRSAHEASVPRVPSTPLFAARERLFRAPTIKA
jgi:hypothetical protein